MRCLVLACVLGLAPAAGWAAEEGIVASWRFDREGAEVPDLSGNGHTARVTGGEVMAENGRKVLRLDGRGRVEVASAPDLNLKRGFSIEARVKPGDLSDGRYIVHKDGEYLLRIDWPVETSQISFFVHDGEGWEPRVSAFRPPVGTWYHLAAVWDGLQSFLWVNGQPYTMTRTVAAPPPTQNPVLIGASTGTNGGFAGCIEYVRIYSRALTAAEVVRKAYGIGDSASGARAAAAAFDFGRGAQGWSARGGASAAASGGGLRVRTGIPGSLVLHDRLATIVGKRDFLSVRMAVDRGSRGEVVYATTTGAGRIPFQTHADGRAHTYILEPWQMPGWGGKLLALGLVPAEVVGATAQVRSVRISEQPQGEGDLGVAALFTESTLPRAGRPERVVARIANAAGPTRGVRVTLRVPAGVTIRGPATRTIPALGYQEQRECAWEVRATAAGARSLSVAATAPGAASGSQAVKMAFGPGLRLPRAAYVPEPRPAPTSRYTVWTHYCPLWKHGTHVGWKAIEPYPERKPVLGWYNEGTPEVADWHIKYWLEHGISAAIYCWYRSNLGGPVQQSLGHAIHDGLLKARYLSRIQYGIMWENGCGKGAGSRRDLMDNVLPFWLDHYFTHPSYLKVDGKPVLYIWVPSNLTRDLGGSDQVRETFGAMRQACRRRGLAGLYIVGCVGAADRETLARMAQEGWDASSAYGNGWSTPKQIRTVDRFVCAPVEGFIDQQQRIWQAKTEFGLLPDITAAMMGWDSRPWNETPFFWSENTPAKFRDLCLRARAAMDAKPTSGPEKRTAIFCCWNEFGEGHYIEPTRGCGFSYLDAIRDVFTDAPKAHTDLAPGDLGRGPYDSWYRRARAAAHTLGPSGATAWRGQALAAWTGMMNLDRVEVKDGMLRAVSTGADSAFSSPALKVRISRFTKLVVEMRVSRPGVAQLFWTTAAYPSTSEAASLHATVPADGQFHRCVFEVGKSEYWGGCLVGMRLDPTDTPGTSIEIRSIALE